MILHNGVINLDESTTKQVIEFKKKWIKKQLNLLPVWLDPRIVDLIRLDSRLKEIKKIKRFRQALRNCIRQRVRVRIKDNITDRYMYTPGVY